MPFKVLSEDNAVDYFVLEVPLYRDFSPAKTLAPMIYSERHLPDRAVEPISGSNVIPRRARPGLVHLRPHTVQGLQGLLANKDTHRPWGGPLPLDSPTVGP